MSSLCIFILSFLVASVSAPLKYLMMCLFVIVIGCSLWHLLEPSNVASFACFPFSVFLSFFFAFQVLISIPELSHITLTTASF